MSSAPAHFVCSRCNKVSGDLDKCATCGLRTQSLESAQRRGWVALGAGAFLILFVSAIWIWLERLLAAQIGDAGATQLGARLNVAFALMILAGALGIANGWIMARSGLRNRPLIYGLVLLFAAALLVAYTAPAANKAA
jgi:magnesium-transporting ATPase (P-type)